MGSTLVWRGCGENMKGVDPPRIHRIGSTLVYLGCGETWKGVVPAWIHRMGMYTRLEEMR